MPHVYGYARIFVGFRSVTEAIDTSTAGGRLLFHIMGALAEFERQLVSERTHAGLQAARARGRRGGRPLALSTDQVTLLRQLHRQGEHPVAQIAASSTSAAPPYTATSSAKL